MKYEELIAKAQSHTPELPEMPEPRAASKVPWDRRTKLVGIGLVLAVYGYLGTWVEAMRGYTVAAVEAQFAMLVPLLVAGLAMALFRRKGFRAQLVVRSLLWSNLVIGFLLALFIDMPAAGAGGAFVTVGSFVSLLGCAKTPLSDLRDATFRPAAYFGRLVAAVALAMADAHTLVFSALTQTQHAFGLGWQAMVNDGAFEAFVRVLGRYSPIWAAAATMALAVWGLVRLRTWALFTNMALNFAIAALAMYGVLGVSTPIAASLTVTAAVQLLVIVPILAAALGQSPRPERPPKWLTLGTAALLALMSLSGLMRSRPFAKHQWSEKRALSRGQVKTRGAPPMAHERPARPARPTKTPVPEAQEITGVGYGCEVAGADWSGLEWESGSKYGGTLLDRCDASRLDASGGRWTLARILKTDLTNADLTGLSAIRSWWWDNTLVGASFEGADLRGAGFAGDVLLGADFAGADLRGASMPRLRLVDVSFRGANLRDANLRHTKFDGVEWEGATCPDGSQAADHGDTCEGQWLDRPVLAPGGYTGWIEVEGRRRRAWLLVGGEVPMEGGSVAGYYVNPREARLAWERADSSRAVLFPWVSVEPRRIASTPLLPWEGVWVVDFLVDEGLEVDGERLEGTIGGNPVKLRRRSRLGFAIHGPGKG